MKEEKITIKGENPKRTDMHKNRRWKRNRKNKKTGRRKTNKWVGITEETRARGLGTDDTVMSRVKCYFPEIKAESGNTIITWTQNCRKLQAYGTVISLRHIRTHHCCGEEKSLWDLSAVCKSTIWYKRNCGPSLAMMVTDRMFNVGGFHPSCLNNYFSKPFPLRDWKHISTNTLLNVHF